MTKQTYIPYFKGRDGGVIEGAFTLPQLRDALDFRISAETSASATNLTFRIAGKGKLHVDQYDQEKSKHTCFDYYFIPDDDETMPSEIPYERYLGVSLDAANGHKADFAGNISALNVNHEKLTKLNVSHCPSLQEIHCDLNYLQELDVTNLPLLRILEAGDNLELAELDVTNCPMLRQLTIAQTAIASIDLSKNPELEYVSVGVSPMKKIDISKNKKLIGFACAASEISHVDFSQNNNIRIVQLLDNRKIKDVDLSNNKLIEDFICNWVESLKLPVFDKDRDFIGEGASVNIQLHNSPIVETAEKAKEWFETLPVQPSDLPYKVYLSIGSAFKELQEEGFDMNYKNYVITR